MFEKLCISILYKACIFVFLFISWSCWFKKGTTTSIRIFSLHSSKLLKSSGLPLGHNMNPKNTFGDIPDSVGHLLPLQKWKSKFGTEFVWTIFGTNPKLTNQICYALFSSIFISLHYEVWGCPNFNFLSKPTMKEVVAQHLYMDWRSRLH